MTSHANLGNADLHPACFVVADQTAEDALTPVDGDVKLRTDLDEIEYYSNSEWHPVSAGGGAFSYGPGANSVALNNGVVAGMTRVYTTYTYTTRTLAFDELDSGDIEVGELIAWEDLNFGSVIVRKAIVESVDTSANTVTLETDEVGGNTTNGTGLRAFFPPDESVYPAEFGGFPGAAFNYATVISGTGFGANGGNVPDGSGSYAAAFNRGTASGLSAFAGNSATASGQYAAAFGSNSEASGNGAATFGASCEAPHGRALAHGYGAKTRMDNSHVLGRRIDEAGDAQTGTVIIGSDINHDDATWRAVSDSNNDGIAVTEDSTLIMEVQLVGMTQAGVSDNLFAYTARAVASNRAGTVVLESDAVTELNDTLGTMEAQLVVDDTNDLIVVQVRETDGTGHIVHWALSVRLTEVVWA